MTREGPLPGKSLRARLAALYACLLLGSGAVLLGIAGLPFMTLGRTSPAHPPGGRPGPARLATNLPEVLGYSGAALMVLAVASVALGWLVADRALRPLRAITATARAISASNLGERLSLAGSYDEFRELGDTLDALFARLEAAFDSQRHFVANASHELRTPLAAERAVLQVALADPGATAVSCPGIPAATCADAVTQIRAIKDWTNNVQLHEWQVRTLQSRPRPVNVPTTQTHRRTKSP